ncbi:fagellar hook-basal body protein [Ammonifex degensii KC4]|uniref:Flagellar hook protein FlgE n=1 Tax=Ammonifex degensii (strain DSM 10501 / KC4) TaxID=429009 RepID=C9R9Y6_AMMDK|nr:flagellar hook-basal body complex protein [Ammonifex degensii]ACX53115.1 fagellar hook-basal body protein [Ammonifex degensii KC4]
MLRSLFSGVSGLRVHQIRMDVIANNIANINTTGFKAARANFQDILSQTLGRSAVNTTQVGLGVSLAAIDNIMTQGALQTTGRALDLAIEGNGFFVVKPVDSSGNSVNHPLYTRDGTFYIDKSGYIVNAQGYRLQSTSNDNIQIADPDKIVSISIGSDGVISVVKSDGTKITYNIGLVTFKNPESLQRVGANLWDVTPNVTDPATPTPGAPGTDGRGYIRSGFLEMSNVDLAQEFTNMIITQRGYQANARVITTSDELLRELVDLKR